MTKLSRRSLAHWAIDKLASGGSADQIARHLAAALAESKMTGQIEFLLSDIEWELEQRRILSVGKVTTAQPLTKKLESALIAQIKKVTKSSTVDLKTTIDKSVMGGVRVETANQVWDSTVVRKLSQLKEKF